MRETLIALLLLLAVAGVLLSAAGLLGFRRVYDRVHFTAPVSILSPAAVALAVALERGLTPGTLRAVVTAFVLIATGPVIAHATARAARLREEGTWNLRRSKAAGGEH